MRILWSRKSNQFLRSKPNRENDSLDADQIDDESNGEILQNYDENETDNENKYEGTDEQNIDPLVLEISSDKSGTQSSGSIVTISAEVKGGDGEYEYRFTETYNGVSTTVQNYSEKSTYEYRAKGDGVHKFTVAVRDGSGNTMSGTYSVTVREESLSLSLSSDKSGTQPSGSIVTISAEAKGGDGEYEYRFTETYNGVSTTVQNYSEKSTYEYRAKGDGVHKFTVAVRDGSGNTMSGTYSVTVREESLSLSLSSDKSGTQLSGSIVTISAEAKGGDGEYEYRFTETYNGVSTTVQNYSEKSTYEYRAKGDGVHKFTVAVRDGSGNTMSGTYSVTVREESLSLSLSSDKSGTQPSGSIVTISAEAKGGDGEYEYRFTETYNGVSTTVQNYSEKSTYEYRAKGDGVHKFTVAVRDGSGNTMSGTYSVTVREESLSLSLSSDKSGTQPSGSIVTISAEAKGGDGEYEYRFTETYNGVSTTVQNYSEKSTYEYRAKGDGVHKFTVAVRDGNGTTMSGTYSVTVREESLSLSLSSDKSGTQPSGSIVTISAEAKGGDGEYEYRFTETYNGVSTTVQNYSEKSTYEYRAKGDGVHKFTVAVREGRGTTISGTYSITVLELPLQITIQSNKGANVKPGQAVTLTANATGGVGEYEYRFTETFQGISTTKQGYSSENTYSFTTGELGEYKYTVAVRDTEGQITSAIYTINVTENVTLQGIDVSAWQGQINWSQVKSSGVSFAMLRALSGTMSNLTVDSQFLNNAIGASSNGIEIGAYRYGYATTVEEARKEALMTIQAIKTAESNGAKFTYPIAYDVEDEATQGKLSKSELTAIIKEFQSVIESYGYKFMIYANRNWLTTKIDMEEFSDVDVWVASWFNDNTPNHDHGYRGPGNVTIWQYTSQGSVPGISGYVDMNVGYGDY